MREIEFKFKLAKEISFETICEVLSGQGIDIVNSTIQVDTVFLLPEQQHIPIVPGSKIARVRSSERYNNKKVTITLKVQGQQRLDSAEYEFDILDEQLGKDFFTALGFVQDVIVKKRRITGKLGEYTLCIDEVYDLGCFIELEMLTDNSEIDALLIQADMIRQLEVFGLDGVISTMPYDTQLKNSRK